MLASFIVRLLTADGELLAWSEVSAESRPQGRPKSTPFMAQGPTTFQVDRDGVAAQLAIHWHDLDVARATPLLEHVPVKAGQVVNFVWIEPVWMVKGADGDVPLPPVTVGRPVRIQIPTGGLAAVGN